MRHSFIRVEREGKLFEIFYDDGNLVTQSTFDSIDEAAQVFFDTVKDLITGNMVTMNKQFVKQFTETAVPYHLENVTRVEVIDETGRPYSEWNLQKVQISFQDQGRTLKVFTRK